MAFEIKLVNPGTRLLLISENSFHVFLNSREFWLTTILWKTTKKRWLHSLWHIKVRTLYFSGSILSFWHQIWFLWTLKFVKNVVLLFESYSPSQPFKASFGSFLSKFHLRGTLESRSSIKSSHRRMSLSLVENCEN